MYKYLNIKCWIYFIVEKSIKLHNESTLSLIQPLVCETVTSNTNVLELCNEEDPPSNKLTQGIYDCIYDTNLTYIYIKSYYK